MDNQRINNDLARARIQIQQYVRRWPPREGLFRGTIFPELYRPYYFQPPVPDGMPAPGTMRARRFKMAARKMKRGKRHVNR